MPRDPSGNYTLAAGNPVAGGTVITTTWANPTMDDLAVAMTDSLSRTGNGNMSVPIKSIDGIVSAPGFSWVNEGTMGIYRPSSGLMGFVIDSTEYVRVSVAKQLEVFRDAVFKIVADQSQIPPAGGTTGQVLNKIDGTDYNTQWSGQVLTQADKDKLDIAVPSDISPVAGSDAVTNLISLTQAEYDGIGTPDAATLYIIVG